MECALSVKDVFDLLFMGEMDGCLMTVYFSYIDDSKDAKKKEAIVSGALLARKRTWRAFGRAWKGELKKYRMKYFKSAQYYGLRGEFQSFRKYPKPEGRVRADKLLEKLKSIVLKYRIYGITMTVPIAVFEKVAVMPASHGYYNCDPYQRCLESVFLYAVRATDYLPGRNNVVAFAHDDDNQFARLRNYYRAFKRTNKQTGKRMVGFVPLDDKKQPALQAADFMANFTKNTALDAIRNSSSLPVKPDNKLRRALIKGGIWTEKYLLGVAKHSFRLKLMA